MKNNLLYEICVRTLWYREGKSYFSRQHVSHWII